MIAPEPAKPDDKPMDAKQCVESADAVTGSLTIVRTMLRDAADKLDETIPRQSSLSRNLSKLFKLDSPDIPRSAGIITVSGLLLLFGIGVAIMGTGVASRQSETESHVSEASRKLDTAHSLLKEGNYKESCSMFLAADMLGGDKTLALGGMAECYYRMEKYDNALATCNRLNKSVPNAGVAYHIRGLVYRKQGKKQEGEEQLRLASRHGFKLATIILNKESAALQGK